MLLTNQHAKLFAKILTRGIGRVCNDLESDEIAMLTDEQWKEFCKAFHNWNGDPETFDEQTRYDYLPDWAVVDYIRYLLSRKIEDGINKNP